MDLNNGVQFTADMPSPASIMALTSVESDVAADGSFDPSQALRVERDAQGNRTGVQSVGRLQLSDTLLRDMIHNGEADGFLSPAEQEVILSGTEDEQDAVMINKAREIDRMALKKVGDLSRTRGFDNPIADGHAWQAPTRTLEAIDRLSGNTAGDKGRMHDLVGQCRVNTGHSRRRFDQLPGMRILAATDPAARQPHPRAGLGAAGHGAGVGTMRRDHVAAGQGHVRQKSFVAAQQAPFGQRLEKHDRFSLHMKPPSVSRTDRHTGLAGARSGGRRPCYSRRRWRRTGSPTACRAG